MLKAVRAARSSPTPAAMAQCRLEANQRETAQAQRGAGGIGFHETLDPPPRGGWWCQAV